MDVDQYIATNEATWTELTSLTRQAEGRLGRARLSAIQIERMVHLYQRSSTHLSHCRTWYGDHPLTGRLTVVVGDARAVIYGAGDRSTDAIGRFFRREFPGEVWAARRFIAIAAAVFLAPALYVGTWMTYSDAAVEAHGPEAVREAYIEEDFEAYYSSAPAAQFSTEVLVNNIRVSFLAFAFGAFACVGTIVVLVLNGLNLGQAGGLFHAAGEAPRFWGLILPHGLLEITAIFVAGGAGLRVGWSIIAPGDLSRAAAFAKQGRRSVPIVIGLMIVFVVAGLIEGFVTPSSLPTWSRVAIGVVVEAAFLAYLYAFGARADAVGTAS